jgi:uncharacterized protein (DUF2252 family)
VFAAATALGCAPPISEESGPGGKADDPDSQTDRAAWVVAEIEAWNAELSEADRAAKYCKMADSPFGFFRGTNHLYWADFADDPRLDEYGNSNTKVWIQGDLHPLNFGSYLDDEGELVYGLNDFDESLVADYQYDLWRMGVGIVLGAELETGLTREEAAAVVDTFVEAYLDAMDDFHGNSGEIELVLDADNGSATLAAFLAEVLEKKTRAEMLDKWTVLDDAGRRLERDGKLEPVTDAERDELLAAMPGYQTSLSGGLAADPDHFRVLDAARRIDAGTGSLGTPRYYILVDGPTADPADDVILDVKEQSPPTPYAYALDARRLYDEHFSDDAGRHATAYKALEVATDDYLGVLEAFEGTYSVRERSPAKDDIGLGDVDLAGLTDLAGDWGLALAAAHARSDRDFDADYIDSSADSAIDDATEGEHAEARELVRQVALPYADQVLADYDAFLAGLAPQCAE